MLISYVKYLIPYATNFLPGISNIDGQVSQNVVKYTRRVQKKTKLLL
jgi:hypothetical protein